MQEGSGKSTDQHDLRQGCRQANEKDQEEGKNMEQ